MASASINTTNTNSPSCDFIFRIPDRFEDLDAVENVSHYYQVQTRDVAPSDLELLLSQAQEAFQSQSTSFILLPRVFDTYYFTIKHFTAISGKQRDEAWYTLYRALYRFQTELGTFLDQHYRLEDRLRYANKLQMLLYLFISLSEFYEDEDIAATLATAQQQQQQQSSSGNDDYGNTGGGGGGRRKKRTIPKVSKVYTDHKVQSTATLLRIMSLNLERIFDSHQFMNSLVNTVTKYVYKLLENSNLAGVANTQLFYNVAELIGIALDRYNHTLNFCMKIIELLQTKETLVNVLAQVVCTNINNQHNLHISDILQQIKSVKLTDLSKDNSVQRAIANFLVEVARNCPTKMFQNLSYLVEFLEEDSYTLRNAVLEIVCIIILEMFGSPRKNRDVEFKEKLLDFLRDHIHDVQAYTRSKVLQLWSRLAEKQAIPTSRLLEITKLIIERLDDRSCFVRKNAVHFLTLTMCENPFMIMRKRDLARFKQTYKEALDRHCEKLRTVQDKQFREYDELMRLQEEEENQRVSSDGGSESSSSLAGKKRKSDEFDFDTDTHSVATTGATQTSADQSQPPVVKKSKKQQMMESIQQLAHIWFDLEHDFCDYWRKKGSQQLDLTENLAEDFPQDSLDAGLEHFRALVQDRQFEQALRVLFALKNLYPTEKLFTYRKHQRQSSHETGDGLNDEDDDDDSQQSSSKNGDSNAVISNTTLDGVFDVNDQIFLSTIMNFTTDLTTKLPYEVDLARVAYLTPLIKFGNAAIEEDETTRQKLADILQRKNRELECAQTDIDRLEATLGSLQKLLHRVEQAEAFIDMLSDSVPKICQLLQSRNIADVQEAINFFNYAFKWELPNTMIGLQKMLKLIFSKEKSVRDKLLEAFDDMYLRESLRVAENDGGGGGETGVDGTSVDEQSSALVTIPTDTTNRRLKSVAFQEIRNLTNMILGLNQGELVCAEALIQEMFKQKKFSNLHVQILWERYALKLSQTTEEEARGALIIIGMLASASPKLIQQESHLNNLVQISLTDRCGDSRLVADTCDVLIRSFKPPSTESCELFFKLPNTHRLFDRLQTILLNSVSDVNTDGGSGGGGSSNQYWYRMASGIIKVVYFFAEKPDYIITNIVNRFEKLVFDNSISSSSNDNNNGATNTDTESQLEPTVSTFSTPGGGGQVSDILVARFLYILGDIAINLLIHLDDHIMKEIKIRQYLKEKETQKLKDEKMKHKAAKDTKKKSANESTRRVSKKSASSRLSLAHSSIDPDDESDDIVGPVSNEDPHQENVTKLCRWAILYGERSRLGRYKRLITNIAQDYDGAQYSLVVRVAACSTLAKFMCLSLNFTREHRNTLAQILDKSRDAQIRSNAIIAFGDLLVRFPNEIEACSGKLFGCLNDSNFIVRSNALKVLNRLILADMIKPKGHISKIAQLVTDDDERIKGAAQLFFIELGKKNNVHIYNFLPGIISNLSGSEGLPEDKFKEMIKFLFERLEKTRNTESLVTKLCQRFKDSSDERKWRDLSFCLTQLQYNERAFVNLMNNFTLFQDTLYCNVIFENFMNIIASIRKTKPEAHWKNVLDEMENKMKEIANSANNNASSSASTNE